VGILFNVLLRAIVFGHGDIEQYVIRAYPEVFGIVLPRLTCYFKCVSPLDSSASLRQLSFAALLSQELPASSLLLIKDLRAMEVRAGEALDRVVALSK
jgi:hypothetical protein